MSTRISRLLILILILCLSFSYSYSIDIWNFKSFVGNVFANHLEEELFYEYKNSKEIRDLTTFLLFGSALPPEKVDYYKTLIDTLVTKISNEIKDKKLSKYDTAKYIFDYLHKNLFKEYKENATTINEIFDTGYYNCVNSTAIYNILLHKFGLTPKVVQLPDHIFSVFYIDSYKVEVETTTKYGFDVVRNPKAIEDFKRITSYSYIPEGSSKRVEIGDEGLIAVVYANQVLLYKDIGKYEEILKASIKALMLEPDLVVAHTNLRSSYIGLISRYNEIKDFDKVIIFAKEGLLIFPNDKDMLQSIEVAYYNSILKKINDKNFSEAFEKIIYIKSNDSSYYGKVKELVGFLVQEWGMSEINKGKYEGIFNIISKGLTIDTNQTYKASINLSYEASRRFSNSGKYELAVTFHKKLLDIFPNGQELLNNLGYFYNVWGVSVMNSGNIEEAVNIFEIALKDLPNDSTLKQNASLGYAKLSVKMFEKKDFSNAIKSINRSYELSPSRNIEEIRLNIYIEWIRFLSLSEEDFASAKKVCDEALKLYPNNPELIKLHKYILGKLK